MPAFSFAAPILPGKTDAWRAAIAELDGPRREAYLASRAALGITYEQATLQSTPDGDLAVVHFVADDPDVLGGMMMGTSDFDEWFREAVLVGIHGFDLAGPPPPPVEVVFENILPHD